MFGCPALRDSRAALIEKTSSAIWPTVRIFTYYENGEAMYGRRREMISGG
jgi:hypothetical protein